MAAVVTKMLGINATKHYVAYALVEDPVTPRAIKADRLAIVGSTPIALVDNLCAIFDSLKTQYGKYDVVICSCSSGASSVQAIKAESLVEYACAKHGLKLEASHPNGFKRALGGSGNDTWQGRAKALLNAEGGIKYFSGGIDGAGAAAIRALRSRTSDKV